MCPNKFNEDKEYWINLTWPAAPNLFDYEIYKNFCEGKVLLLGSTKLLLPLCSEAWDINPKYIDNKIKNKDWFNITEYWDTIILDGGLSLYSKEEANKLLQLVLKNCNSFITRVFLKPNWKPKYAKYFPKGNELNPAPDIELSINNVYSFYIWNKKLYYQCSQEV